MKKRFSNCTIHIGTEKTGTKSIQHFLKVNQKAILREGVCYPTTNAKQNGSQWEFVTVSHPSPWTMDVGRVCNVTNNEDKAEFTASFTELLNRQFRLASKADTLLISSEHFHSRLNTDSMVTNLKAYLDQWAENYKIIVYFRRQDQLALSHFSTRIKSGYKGRDPMMPPVGYLTPYYQYDLLAERWGKVFGHNNISAGLYSDILTTDGSILKDFCKRVGVKSENKKIPVRKLNSSLNSTGLNFIQSLNFNLQKYPTKNNRKTQSELIEVVSELCPGRVFPIGRQKAKDFYEHYKKGNECLRQSLFSNYPAPLFKESFEDYPEIEDNFDPNHDDAVEIAIKLWSHKRDKGQTRLFNRLVQYIFNR